MWITMSYGKTGLKLNLPDAWDITLIKKKRMPVLDNPVDSLAGALANPVDCAPIAKLVQGKKSVCILICDITRPVPNHLFLRPLIEELTINGVALSDITVLVATGLHRPNEGVELVELVGDTWVLENVRVENHFACDDRAHVKVGITSRGTVAYLDRRFVTADIRIATGLVEPHFMAGFSGGRKVITPGVAHTDTITHLHTATFLEDSKATTCVLDRNPLHEELLEIVNLIGGSFAINTIIDEKRRLSFINFGEIKASHAQAVKFVRLYVEVPLDQLFTTVLTGAGGYPLDKTYYQTVKGMVGGMEIMAQDGNLFVVAEISEGMGSQEYVKSQEKLVSLGPKGFMENIRFKKQAAIDEWQTEMQLKPMRKGQVHLYTTAFKYQQRNLTGIDIIDDKDELLRRISLSLNQDKRLAIITEGPYVHPFLKARHQGVDVRSGFLSNG